MLILKFKGEDIWGPRHLCEGAQLSAAGVCHQRHHCQPQVCGLGAQWGAGAWDKCDQGPGLALHLKLHPQHWRRVPLPGWILIEDNLSSVYFWFWNLLFVICLHPIFMIRCNTEVSLNHVCLIVWHCLTAILSSNHRQRQLGRSNFCNLLCNSCSVFGSDYL